MDDIEPTPVPAPMDDIEPTPVPAPTPVFSNPVIDPAGLEPLPEEEFGAIERQQLTAELIVLGIVGFVVAVGAVALSVALDRWLAVAVVVPLVATAALAAAIVVSFRYRGWLLREHDISHRSGVFIRSTDTVPFARVQHTSITVGPLDRFFDLARLSVFSASGGAADLQIRGLRPDVAASLQARVAAAAADARA